MDPDVALARLVELCERIANGAPQDVEWAVLVTRAEELAETFLGLDEWARRGGFLPKAWQHRRNAPDGAMQQRIALLEKACRALLQDTDEVLERQGETWWGDTVTSGLHHRQEARRILGDEAGR